MSQKPGISIIIVSHNVWDYLDKCILSILSQKGIMPEIIVVDNNSTDGTLNKLNANHPDVHIISNKSNAGFSAANNQGIKAVTTDVILLLNPDTEITGLDTLRKMTDYLLSDTNIGIVAPKLLNTDGSLQPSFWNFPRVTVILLELFFLHTHNKSNIPSVPKEIQGASGAALCLQKSLADSLGGLDENLFWMEDIDLCYRVAKTGKKIMFNPGLMIIHHGGKSSVNKQFVTIPNQVISKIKYFRKNGSWMQFAFSNFFSLLFIISRLVVFSALSISGNSIYMLKRKAYFKAFSSYMRYNFAGDKGIIS